MGSKSFQVAQLVSYNVSRRIGWHRPVAQTRADVTVPGERSPIHRNPLFKVLPVKVARGVVQLHSKYRHKAARAEPSPRFVSQFLFLFSRYFRSPHVSATLTSSPASVYRVLMCRRRRRRKKKPTKKPLQVTLSHDGERSSRATVSFEEQIMSKDNYSYIFAKPKVVCLYYPSNISSHSESSGAKQNKTRSKTRWLFGAFWHCFLNRLPNFLISKLEKTLHFEVCSPGGSYWLRACIISWWADVFGSRRERKYLMDYILPIFTTSLMRFLFKRLENVMEVKVLIEPAITLFVAPVHFHRH